MSKLIEALDSVSDRKSFVVFLNQLANDLKNNQESWENSNLELYIQSLGSYTEDIDGYYANLNNPEFNNLFEEVKKSYGNNNMEEVLNATPGVFWRVMADILFGAKSYE
jgi:hypothetical protein